MIAFNTDRTDEDLFAQFQHCGCQDALAELHRRYYWGLVSYLRRRGIVRDDEDIVQNVWLKLLIGSINLRNVVSNFRGLIFSIVRFEKARILRNARTRRQRLQQVYEQTDHDYVSSYVGHGQTEEKNNICPERVKQIELLRKGLAQAPVRRRELFIRYYAGSETQREISSAEGLTKQQLCSCLVKQKNRLRTIIESGGADLNIWTAENIALLGTAMDSDIAKQIGAGKRAVTHKRNRLGIPPFIKRWTTEEIALLGTATDTEIARKMNRKPNTVLHKRRELGIPAFSKRVAV